MSAFIFNKPVYIISVGAILCFGWSMEYKIHVHIPPAVIQDLRDQAEICSKETGVPASTIRKMIGTPLPNEEPIKKFLYCICFNSGYTDEDGHFIVEKMATMQVINGTVDNFKNVLRECNEVSLESNVETIYAMGICLHENYVFTV